jgi:uncharacterized small protein (DUF1192 family)
VQSRQALGGPGQKFAGAALTRAGWRASIDPMDMDDLPRTRPDDLIDQLARQDLDPLSVAELDERVAALEAEIARVRAHQSRAISHRAVADSLFKR